MKKAFKILAAMRIVAIIALAAAIWFSTAACKGGNDDDDYPDPPKQFLKVTDIPSEYKDMYGIILFSPPNSSAINVYSALEKINGTSCKFPLYVYGENDPWEGSGKFCVKILIFENSATNTWTYVGATEKTNITASTVITWSLFTQKP